MSEAEWLACADPELMLEFLRGKASDRKLRLFSVACCRLIWGWLADERIRRAVEVAERYADGLATSSAIQAAFRYANDRYQEFRAFPSVFPLVAVACATSTEDGFDGQDEYNPSQRQERYDGYLCAGQAARWGGTAATLEGERGADIKTTHRPEAACLRCIFGPLPFRRIAASPSWSARNDGGAAKLAQYIYDDRAFDRLPLLADALEDAGCTDRGILDHCRSGGQHVRGCWAVDLLLGKS